LSQNSRQIKVKLWGEKADIAMCVGDTVTITNLKVNEWGHNKYVNSTDETNVEV